MQPNTETPKQTPKAKTERPTEKISPQNTVGSTTQDRTPNGDTSRGVDTGSIEVGATGKRGQFAG
jgi:hypothetical protein